MKTKKRQLSVLSWLSVLTLVSCNGIDEYTVDYEEVNRAIETELHVKTVKAACISSLDILVFNNDRLRHIDAYQRHESGVGESVKVSSRSGDKIIAVIANAAGDKNKWAGVNSFEGLQKVMSELKDENPEYPVLSGTVRHYAKNNGSCEIRLEPLMSEVLLNSICCDFSSRQYAGRKMKDVKIYLTNVSGSCPVIYDSTYNISSVINYGKLRSSDFSDFICPDMISAAIDGEMDEGVIFPGIKLYCYPNSGYGASISSPPTRIVVEGTIDGRKYYYPININAGGYKAAGFRPGIERNRSYVLDMVITRLGVDDPDTPVESGDFQLNFSIKTWKDYDEEIIKY